jgi:hypothetical protein
MKKALLGLICTMLTTLSYAVAVTGTKTVAASGGDYPTLDAAITDLNGIGISGNVIINVPAGWTETAPTGGYLLGSATLNASVTSSATLTIQKSGTGADPLLTAPVGGSLTIDGIFKIQGTDYVTINGIDLQESASNSTTTTRMEWGYALVKSQNTAPFDGCQSVTIKNCTVTLNKADTASVCIYAGNHIATDTTSLTITATTDAMNNGTFTGNTLSNTNRGVSLRGFTGAASTYTLYDQNNTIGGASAALGNSITEFGGTGTAGYGIYIAGQSNASAMYNSIASATTPGTGALRAIFIGQATNASFTASYNTIQMTASTGQVYGIANGAASVNSGQAGTGTLTITNNTFQNYSFTSANSVSNYLCVYNYAGTFSGWTLGTVNVSGNVVRNMSLNATANTYLFYNSSCSSTDMRFNNNKISNIRQTGTTGNIYCYYNFAGFPSTGQDSVKGNKIANVKASTSLYCIYEDLNNNTSRNNIIMFDSVINDSAGISSGGGFYGVYNTYGKNVTVKNNYIADNYYGSAGASLLNGIFSASSLTVVISDNVLTGNNVQAMYGINCGANNSVQVNDNVVKNNTSRGSSVTYGLYNAGTIIGNWYNNTVYNNSSTGTGTIYGIYSTGTNTTINIYSNSIGLLSTASGALFGSYLTGLGIVNYYNNLVDSLTNIGGPLAYGVWGQSSLTTFNCYKNKISYLLSNSANANVRGILLNAPTNNVYNNIVGNLQAPNATGNGLFGIYCDASTSGHTLSYNTVVLNAASIGTNGSSSAIYHNTAASLKLRNNIFINTSAQSGTGIAGAYRRSSTSGTTYNATSDNNLFYAGTPGANRVIMYDGANSYQAIAAFKTAVSPADANSFTENTTFQNLTGIATDFLRPSLSVPTLIEGRAVNVTGITDDSYGAKRAGNPGYTGSATLPDVGAIEDNYTAAPTCTTPPAITGRLTVCAGDTAQLANTTTGGSWSSASTSVATIDASTGLLTSATSGTAVISYTVSGGCYNTATVTVSTLPTAFGVTGGGSYCSGGTGVSVGLGNSVSGIDYQLYNGTSITGSTVAGTGSALDFGMQTAAGTYTVRATNAITTCVSSMTGSATVSVNVLPAPFGVTGGGSYCSGGTGVSVGLDNSVSGIDYQLYNGTSTAGIPVAGTGSALDFGMQTAAGTYTVRATNATTSCVSGMTGDATVSINTRPAAFDVTGGGSYCSGGTGVSIGLDNSETGIDYQLYNGTSTAGSPVAGTGSALGFGLQTAAGTYTVRATNATTSCVSGMTGSASIAINPLPVLSTSYSGGAICNSTAFHYTPGSVVSGTTFAWSRAAAEGISNAAGSGTDDPAETLVNASTAPIVVTYAYVLTANGCSNAQNVGVTVKPTPVLSSALTPAAICNNTVFNYMPMSATTGTTFAWNRAAVTGIVNSADNGTDNPEEELVNTTTVHISVVYIYTLTANGCSNNQEVTVNVNPTPVLTSTLTASPVCSSNTFNYSPTSATTGTTFNWSRATVAGISNASASGSDNPAEVLVNTTSDPVVVTYVYTLTANNCNNSQSVSVVINPSALLSTSLSGGAICSGNTFSYNPASGTPGTTFVWSRSILAGISTVASSGNDGISETLTNTTLVNIPVTYAYSLTANGCTVTQNVTMTVNALPAVYNVTGGGNFCTGSTGVVTGLNGSQIGVNYQIFKADSLAGTMAGTGSPVLFPLQSAVGNYTVFATNATTGCVNNMSGSATIVTAAVPTPVVGPNALCSGTTGLLSSTTAGGTWTSNANGIISIGSATGSMTTGATVGYSIITYAVTSTCRAFYTVSNNQTPVSFTGSPTVCIGGTMTFGTAPSGGVWSSTVPGVAVVSTGGAVTGAAIGTSLISYVMPATGCYRTGIINVVTTPGSIAGTTVVCNGLSVELSNPVTGGSWSGSGGYATLAQNVAAGTCTVTGATAGTFNITYSIGTCRVSTPFVVNGLPAFTTGILKACPGTTTSLANVTTGGIWSSETMEVGTVSASGIVTGLVPGTTSVRYTLATGCYRVNVVTVNPLPAITGATSVCTGATTNLNAGSTGTWTSSNTSVASAESNGAITGLATGTSTISFTSTSTGCPAATTVNVTGAMPVTGAFTVCAGNTTSLDNATPGGIWSGSNASVATVGGTGMVTGILGGTTAVSYSLPGGCSRVIIVTVNTLPNITSTPAVCLGTTTTLSATPAGGTWTGGTTGIASLTSTGVINGLGLGTSPISYTSTNGCFRSAVATVSAPVGSISGGTTVCTGSTLSLSTGISGGTWTSSSSGNAAFSGAAVSTGVLSGIVVGNTIISYINGGCSASTTIAVIASPSVVTGTKSACIGSTTTLSCSPAGGTWLSANPANAGISAGVVSGISTGTASIVYTATNGCTAMAVVTVNALPAITGPTAICEGASAALTTDNSATVSWTSSSPGVATVTSAGVATGISAGNTTIDYTVSSGCSTSVVLNVNPRPAAIGGALSICTGVTATLTSTPGGNWSSTNVMAVAVGASGDTRGLLAGQTVISYTFANGCYRTAIVTVNGSPTINGSSTICTGGTTFLSAAGSGTWSSLLPSTASVPVTHGLVTGLLNGSAEIVFTWAGNGCTASRTVNIAPCPRAAGNNATAVGETGTMQMTFFPNPTKGMFTVSAPEAGTLSVFAVDGRAVLSGDMKEGLNEVTLPTGISGGIYVCRFTAINGTVTSVRMVFEKD